MYVFNRTLKEVLEMMRETEAEQQILNQNQNKNQDWRNIDET